MLPLSVASLSPAGNSIPHGLSRFWAYRIRLPLTAGFVIAGVCGTLFTAPDVLEGSVWDHRLDGLAWCLLVAAIVLRLWAASHISGRKSKTLVTTGPYAICRNPLYHGTLLIAVSQLLILKSLPFAMACVFPIALYAVGVVRAEERFLMLRLGTAYQDYCQLVPRWTPRWRALNFHWTRPESWRGFRSECARCAWWLLLPLVSEFIARLREWIWSIG